MGAPTIQVVIDKGIKQRLELLAASQERSVSSLVRALIVQYLLALDRQVQSAGIPTLDEFYKTL